MQSKDADIKRLQGDIANIEATLKKMETQHVLTPAEQLNAEVTLRTKLAQLYQQLQKLL